MNKLAREISPIDDGFRERIQIFSILADSRQILVRCDYPIYAKQPIIIIENGCLKIFKINKRQLDRPIGIYRPIKDPNKNVSLEDLHDYLEVLENFLPLCRQENNDTTTLYKLFIRILAHEWEAVEPKPLNSQKEIYAFSWIMKMTRNWLAHSKVFEQLTPQDVAYLFIVNIRTMFDLGDDLLPYEKHLLSLFTTVISTDEMTDRIGDNPRKRNDKNPNGRNIPLVENYASILKKNRQYLASH